MDSSILKAVTDVISDAFWIFFGWEMAKAAKALANPEPDGIERILRELRQNRLALERVLAFIEDTEGENENPFFPSHTWVHLTECVQTKFLPPKTGSSLSGYTNQTRVNIHGQP